MKPSKNRSDDGKSNLISGLSEKGDRLAESPHLAVRAKTSPELPASMRDTMATVHCVAQAKPAGDPDIGPRVDAFGHQSWVEPRVKPVPVWGGFFAAAG